MADAGGIDVLMRIVPTEGGAAMSAESQNVFPTGAPTDSLLKDFVSGQCCELQDFDFSAGIESALDKKKKEEDVPASELSGITAPVGSFAFERDRAIQLQRNRLQRVEARARGESVDMQPVSYSRQMDSASTLLFKALTECTTLATISIVKRLASGTPHGGQGYLRMDFKDVLLIDLKWNDGDHRMIESGEFIYRELKMQYRPQKADGSLDVAVSAEWKMQATRTGT